ncbi:MAG: phosphogluconate dehydratase [Caulobacterales bacterium]|nr:phosphogluconate dehydratase [Caulobacterales bacterium]
MNPPLMNAVVAEVTRRIVATSRASRSAYLDRIAAAGEQGPGRGRLSCANWAHAFAASPVGDRLRARAASTVNVGIVTAFNDMLSAHQPFEDYPARIREAARSVGATAQVAGATPAMCDGVTQGRAGMELSLFSRDVIAMSTAIALSHDAFDAALCLGVCDKIVPGLLMGALSFGHLPVLFVPAGPMSSGLSNPEKAEVRGRFAEGKASREELLEAEQAAYHGPGTCTFYGTANSNQLLMEAMGLHLPGAAFAHPGSPLREAMTRAATHRAIVLAEEGSAPLARVIDEKAVVNGVVALLATGGSTNHAIHLVAIARAAGILIDWDDFDALSAVTPLLARVYPNGAGDVNHFQAAGGAAFVIRELLDAGLMHDDVVTVAGPGLRRYALEPALDGEGALVWRQPPPRTLDALILRPVAEPFSPEGGLKLVRGVLGRGVVKVSAVAGDHRVVEAPALVFDHQDQFLRAFEQGELDQDFVAVLRFQGPRANGMPELHSLTPALSVLQDRGRRVALVTDGRMSGASGKVPAAIHVTPEAAAGGPLARVKDGDVIRLDCDRGVFEVLMDEAVLLSRPVAVKPLGGMGCGRELFGAFRASIGSAEAGASVLFS